MKREIWISVVLVILIESVVLSEDLTLELAKSYVAEGRYTEAISAYQSIASANPGTNEAFKAKRELAVIHILQGNETEALSEYQSLLNCTDIELKTNAITLMGESYCKIKDYEKARQMYQQCITTWPDAGGTMGSYQGIAALGVIEGNDVAVTTAVDKIISDFSTNKKLGKTIYEITLQCCDSKKFELAETVYQKFMAKYSGSEQALLPLAGMAFLKFETNDDTAAHTLISGLKADFAGNSKLPGVLYNIARLCERGKKADKVLDLYQYVIGNWPGNPFADRAQIDLAVIDIVSLIDSDQDSQAQAAYSSLISMYGSHPKIARSLFFVGEAYYNRASRDESEGRDTEAQAYLVRATTIWERILQQSPYQGITEYAKYFCADCYRQTGEYEMAIEYYAEVVNNWPGFEYSWNAQFLTGRMCEKLQEAGQLSESEAEPLIRAAYETLLAKYPNCKSAKAASNWLSQHNSK